MTGDSKFQRFDPAKSDAASRPAPVGAEGALRLIKLQQLVAVLDRYGRLKDGTQIGARQEFGWFQRNAWVPGERHWLRPHHKPGSTFPNVTTPGRDTDRAASHADITWDAAFLRAELNCLVAEQQDALFAARRPFAADGAGRSHAPSDALGVLKKALVFALDGAYFGHGVLPKERRIEIAGGHAREILRRYPGRCWGDLWGSLDAHYVAWRKERWTQRGRPCADGPGCAPMAPELCPIPLHVLLTGRSGYWRPHPLLHRWLSEQANKRETAMAVADPVGHVRLIAPLKPSSRGGSRFAERRSAAGEIEALKERLAKPRPLAPAGDVDASIAALYARFPWFASALNALRRDIIARAKTRHGGCSFAPILLLGPPGVGKSRFVRALAEAFALPFQRVDRAGETDNRDFAGTAKGWASAEVAMPVRLLARIDVANPLIFVDEIDKESMNSRNGAVSRTLLTWLEPETAADWQDPCLGVPVDLSHVMWALGANSTRSLRGPLLSRVTTHEIGAPGPEHFDALLASILSDLRPTISNETDDEAPIELLPEAIERLRHRFERERMSARNLRRAVEAALQAGYAAIVRRALN